MKYRADIDGLRTIAVVPVLIFHAGLGLPGGFVGVDVFFVISGFLITTILWDEMKNGTYSILRFYERRIRRIFPALFAVLALTTLVATALMLPYHLDDYGKSLAGAMLFLSNVWFYLSTGYFNESAEIKPLLHTWSLAIEEQYYVVFPVLLWGLFRVLGRAVIWWVLAGLAVLSLALAVWAVGADPEGAFYLPQYRAWELFVGSLLAIALSEGWLDKGLSQRAVTVPLALAGLAAILWAMIAYRPDTPFPGLAALPPCLGAAALIATGARMQTPVSRLLATSPMVFIGKISYSLYLWHWPVIVFAFYTNVEELSTVQGIGCLAVSFLLAWASYQWIEQPVRRNTHDKVALLFGGGVAAIIVAVGVGGLFVVTDGLPQRLSPVSVALLDGDYGNQQGQCHRVTPARAAAGDVCVRGADGVAPSMMLAGDSHAGALAQGFFEAAAAAGVAGYQYSSNGFRPLLGVEQRGDPAWGRQSEAFAAFLSAHPEIRTVYMTVYWQHQISGSTYRHTGDVWTDAGYDGSGTAYDPVATVNGLTRLVETFPDRQFVLLDDVPTGHMLDLRTAVRALRFGHVGDWSEAGISAQEAAAQRGLYEPVVTAFAAAHDTVTYRPVFAGLCTDQLCPLFDGMEPRFRDGDHLSPAGSERMVPVLRDALFSGPVSATDG